VGFHVLRGPRPQDVGHLCFGYCFDSKVRPGAPLLKAPHSQSNLKSPQTCATVNFLIYFIISIAVLENMPHDAGLQKRATGFSTLNVGLAGTGNQSWATCVAGSVIDARPSTTPAPLNVYTALSTSLVITPGLQPIQFLLRVLSY
jgi:hypothetical protein